MMQLVVLLKQGVSYAVKEASKDELEKIKKIPPRWGCTCLASFAKRPGLGL